jgi:hypothetical protein
VTPFLVAQHSSTAASIRSVTCGRSAEPRESKTQPPRDYARVTTTRSRAAAAAKMEAGLVQQERLTIAERTGTASRSGISPPPPAPR